VPFPGGLEARRDGSYGDAVSANLCQQCHQPLVIPNHTVGIVYGAHPFVPPPHQSCCRERDRATTALRDLLDALGRETGDGANGRPRRSIIVKNTMKRATAILAEESALNSIITTGPTKDGRIHFDSPATSLALLPIEITQLHRAFDKWITNNLHVYSFNVGLDMVIAVSEDDARAVFREYYGPDGEAALSEEEIVDQIEVVRRVDDETVLAVAWDSDLSDIGGEADGTREMEARAWAVERGRGYFCGSES